MLDQQRRWIVLLILVGMASISRAAPPNPVLNHVFPAGGQIGQAIDLKIAGSGLVQTSTLDCRSLDLKFDKKSNDQFQLSIPKGTPPGLYDLRAVCENGLSSPRMFLITNRVHALEVEPNDKSSSATPSELNRVLNGRIQAGGDLDYYRFSANKGQRVVVECWASRLDSKLRAVLEIFDANGRRLAVNRGFFGIDPLIDFHVPEDGEYIVKVHDLIFSGSTEHYYCLEIDTGPRVAFAVPSVIEKGNTEQVTLFGWNLRSNKAVARSSTSEVNGPKGVAARAINYDSVTVEITAPDQLDLSPIGLRLAPSQVALNGFSYHLPGSNAPIAIGVTDVPVHVNTTENQTHRLAAELEIPAEVSGQLIEGDEQDWFAINARRGEVLWIEAMGERIGSPVDLAVSVLDSTGNKVLAEFRDEVRNSGGKQFPTNHLDPSGHWVVPTDGRYFVMIRNLTGGLDSDPRRLYRLSIRRQEPEFHLAVVSRRGGPATLNIPRGGRTIVDVLAFRRRGLNQSIRVVPKNLPVGVECPEIWFGPNINRVPLVVSASQDVEAQIGSLGLYGQYSGIDPRKARGGTMVRTGLPNGWGRLTDRIAFSVAGDAPIRLTANAHENKEHHLYGNLVPRHSPGSVVDVAIEVERVRPEHQADVQLIGVGLPPTIRNQTATIPAGKNVGHVSFYLPPTLPVGKYSFVVQGSTSVAVGPKGKDGKQKTESVTIFSNPVTIDVKPAAFVVDVDPYNPRKIRRGEIVQVKYTCRRINGFISKIHTELAAPKEVVGLRGRGVTFVGQTESGTIQVIANENAPLGQQPFLRLYAVGVLEDEPVFRGSCFLNLEVVE